MGVITYALSDPVAGEYGQVSGNYADFLQDYYYLWSGRDINTLYETTWRLDPDDTSTWETGFTSGSAKATAFTSSGSHTDTKGDTRPLSVGGVESTSNDVNDAERHDFVGYLKNPLITSPSWANAPESKAKFRDAATCNYQGELRMINGTEVNTDGTSGSILQQHYKVTGCPDITGNTGCSGFSIQSLSSSKVPEKKTTASAAVASESHNTIIMVCGFNGNGGNADVMAWSQALGSFTQYDSDDYLKRSAPGIIRNGDFIYIFGGQLEDANDPNSPSSSSYSGDNPNDHSIVRIEVTKWPDEGAGDGLNTNITYSWPRRSDDSNYSDATDYPYVPRANPSAVMINDEIWLLGGWDGDTSSILTVDTFTIDSNNNLNYAGTGTSLPDERFAMGDAYIG